MTKPPPLPEYVTKPTGSYVVPAETPHFGGLVFKVPEKEVVSGLVIYASGFVAAGTTPMVLAVHPLGLFLADVEGEVWHRTYERLRGVKVGSPVTVTVPIKTSQGWTEWILEDAATVELTFAQRMKGSELTNVLATFLPEHASQWVGIINTKWARYQDLFTSVGPA